VTAAVFAVVFVPVIAFGMYRLVGNPDLPDEPLAARLNEAPADANMDVAAAVAKIEAYLAQHPDDGKGWEVIAPIYLNLGRGDDAVTAYANALRLLGETSDRLEAYGRALVFAAGNQVTPKAVEAFKAALAKDPGLAEARFFLGVAAEQGGDKTAAVDIWSKLLADAPPGAEWVAFVRQKIVADGGNPPPSMNPPEDSASATPDDRLASPPAGEAAAVAALPTDDQQKFIHKMVDGLADRLHQDCHDVDGWLRLTRAYNVLREPDKARDALADARKCLGSDSAALARLDQLAHELGLEG
jgi:cytochrome c-type biogenesis protein CcmH